MLKVDKYEITAWDDTKRAEIGLVSLQFLLKWKILEIWDKSQITNIKKDLFTMIC